MRHALRCVLGSGEKVGWQGASESNAAPGIQSPLARHEPNPLWSHGWESNPRMVRLQRTSLSHLPTVT